MYNLETLKYKSGKFDNFCDAAYVLTLTSNNRIDSFLTMYEQFIPCKTLHILHNEGFHNCEKNNRFDEKIDSTWRDIEHSETDIYKDAEKKGYNNILVLEDDCIFTFFMKSQFLCNRLGKWVKNSKHGFTRLGCIYVPFRIIPANLFILGSIGNSKLQFKGAHAYILSKKMRHRLLNIKQDHLCQADSCFRYNIKQHTLTFAFAVQTHPVTENMKNGWGNPFIISILKRIKKKYTIIAYYFPLITYILFLSYISIKEESLIIHLATIIKTIIFLNSFFWTGLFNFHFSRMILYICLTHFISKDLMKRIL